MATTEDVAGALDGRDDWEFDGDDGWRTEDRDGRLIGLLRLTAGAVEARVLRRPTGPSPGPDPEEAHGPRVFEDPAAAVAYVEANLGRSL